MTCTVDRRLAALFVAAVLVAPIPAAAQDPPAATPPQERTTPGEIKPYERVITKEAKSDAGVFTVHQIGDKLLLRDSEDAVRARSFSGSARSRGRRLAPDTADRQQATAS